MCFFRGLISSDAVAPSPGAVVQGPRTIAPEWYVRRPLGRAARTVIHAH